MKILLTITMTMLTVMLFAFSALYSIDGALGEFNYPLDATSCGMGSIRIFTDPVTNPSLVPATNGYYAAGGLSGISYSETRFDYIFDSYDNNIGKKTSYDNTNLYGEPAYISAYLPFSGIGLFLGYQNLVSTDYDYSKINRDNYYVILSTEEIAQTGEINAYYLSVSYTWKWFTVGGNIAIMQGDASKTYNAVYVDPALTDSSNLISEQFSGFKGGFALTYKPDDMFDIAGFYQLPTYVKSKRSLTYYGADTTLSTEEKDYSMPQIFGIGVKYRPANVRPVTFAAEAIYENWAAISGSFGDYNDVIDYHVGIEHQMSRNISMLYGIFYEPYRRDNHIADIGFTAGMSYMINNVKFTVAGRYGQNSYDEDGSFYQNRTFKFNADIGIAF